MGYIIIQFELMYYFNRLVNFDKRDAFKHAYINSE